MGPQLFDPNVGINMALQQRGQDINYQGAMAQANASRSAGKSGMFGNILGSLAGGYASSAAGSAAIGKVGSAAITAI
jgi:hypothetical protein